MIYDQPFDPGEGEDLCDLKTPATDPFIIPDVIHDAATVLFGRPEAGKSFVMLAAAHAIASGGEWIGRQVSRPGGVGILALDPGQRGELARRRELLPATVRGIRVYGRAPRLDPLEWERFGRYLWHEDIRVLFVDNLSRLMAPGRSYRDDESVRQPLACLDRVIAYGVAVVLVHHAGKPGEADRAGGKTPIGSTAIEGWARHLVRVEGEQGKPGEPRALRLVAWGNDAAGVTLALRQQGLTFTLTEDDGPATGHDRSAERAARMARAREWLISNGHENLSQRQQAELLAPVLGVSADTVRRNILRHLDQSRAA